MGSRVEDPNKLVVVTCKVPAHVRDKFAGLALIAGDIKVARRLERLILADVESAKNIPSIPSAVHAPVSNVEDDSFASVLGDQD